MFSKIYDKHNDFDLDIVDFPVLDNDVLCLPSYEVYISQLIRFATGVVMLMTLMLIINV